MTGGTGTSVGSLKFIEPPYTDPYVRWWRVGAVRPLPIPIHSMMLSAFARNSAFRASMASPAPRKMALMRKRNRMTPFVPKSTAQYVAPISMTGSGVAMSRSISGAKKMPARLNGIEMARKATIACIATTPAPLSSYSPIRGAIMAVTPMPRRKPMASTRMMSAAPAPTVLRALAPSRPTK